MKQTKKFHGINFYFRSKKHGTSMVKQPMIALYTFDDKGYYIKRYERVPWGFSENENGD